jgi:sugar phosphate isomerase/epimerase
MYGLMVEYLPSMPDALALILSTTKEKALGLVLKTGNTWFYQNILSR